MKKAVFVLLILLGFVFGYWLARENRRLLMPTGVMQAPEEATRQQIVDMDGVAVGMDMWQVKEAWGPPEKRNIQTATPGVQKEQWVYSDKCLHFTNGVLTSWQSREALRGYRDEPGGER
jgi:hypothetical protein